MIFEIVLWFAIKKMQQNTNGPEVYQIYRLLVFCNVRLLGEDIIIVQKNKKRLSDASMDIGLEVKAGKRSWPVWTYLFGRLQDKIMLKT